MNSNMMSKDGGQERRKQAQSKKKREKKKWQTLMLDRWPHAQTHSSNEVSHGKADDREKSEYYWNFAVTSRNSANNSSNFFSY
jgi:hypothetical protein